MWAEQTLALPEEPQQPVWRLVEHVRRHRPQQRKASLLVAPARAPSRAERLPPKEPAPDRALHLGEAVVIADDQRHVRLGLVEEKLAIVLQQRLRDRRLARTCGTPGC